MAGHALDREGVEVNKNKNEIRTRTLSSHLDPTNLINKGFVYGQDNNSIEGK